MSPLEAPNDDPEGIPDGSHVFRRIYKGWWVPDGTGGRRLTSQAFQDSDGYMSVGVGQVLTELGMEPKSILDGHSGYGLARLDATHLRRTLSLGLTRIPTTAEPWHGGVWGKKTGSVKSQMRERAEVIVEPVDSPAPEGS